ncbi:MAG: hypothetical protein KDD36_10585 [Flavobacteriales bacterium]|nr:hypothetical protein [Flavobacteriales bacterium]
MLNYTTIFLFFCFGVSFAQDTLNVHFLYGSRPAWKFRDEEVTWFGGKWGSHVGVEGEKDQIVNFLPRGKFHLFAKKNNRHSMFASIKEKSFYALFGGEPDSMKKAVFHIPVTPFQKHCFDSITAAYLANSPYDYAFVGMRCGAAGYDILSQLDILTKYSYRKTYRRIFYPRRLRKRLFRKAREKGWKVETREGTARRKWERN